MAPLEVTKEQKTFSLLLLCCIIFLQMPVLAQSTNANKNGRLSELIKALSDEDENVRYRAAKALGKMGPTVIPALITVLAKSKNADARMYAAIALGRIGLATKEVIQALITAFSDEDDIVKIFAKQTLRKIGHKAVPMLIKDFSDKNKYVRNRAAKALQVIGSTAVPAFKNSFRERYYQNYSRAGIR